ncbi:radical SAM superfamily protein, partial [Vibrio parahaemolyticus EKP-028]
APLRLKNGYRKNSLNKETSV